MRKELRLGEYERTVNGRSGAVLVAVLLLLLMVTVLGVFSATRASMEQRISANEKENTMAFYSADGGLDHSYMLLKAQLENSLNTDATNIGKRAQGLPPVWNFLINPTTGASASQYYCADCDGTTEKMVNGAWISGGVQVLSRTFNTGNLDVRYTVTAWNNDESGNSTAPCTGVTSATNDCDGVIIVRSVAQAFVAGTTTNPVAESVVQAAFTSGTASSVGGEGLADPFANTGKTSTATDVNDITAANLASTTNM